MIHPESVVEGEWADWYALIVERMLSEEERLERERDRAYWQPLKAELEAFRQQALGKSRN